MIELLNSGEPPPLDPARSAHRSANRATRSSAGAALASSDRSAQPRLARPYSTVTLFARLRGWSTSFPMNTAT
jgi:hypothetical protein